VSSYNRARLARIDSFLHVQEELAILERVEAESRLSNIVRSQSAIRQGERSIFSAMVTGSYAGIATYSMVDANEFERQVATARQGELKQLRGMRKAFARILEEGLRSEQNSENEEKLQELAFRVTHRKG
jgi:hypothetical protein